MVSEALTTTGNLILNPLYALWVSLVSIIPSIVLAILILILGYCVAYLLGYLVRVGLEKLGISQQVRKAQLSKEVGHTNIPALVGEVTKWFVFIIFLSQAVEVLQLGVLSDLLMSFMLWLPNLLVAVLVFFAGVAFVHLLDAKLKEHTTMKGMKFIAAVLKVVIFFLVVVLGLRQIGVDVSILQNSFLILLGALGLGIALALGIGLGLGLKDEARGLFKEMKKHL